MLQNRKEEKKKHQDTSPHPSSPPPSHFTSLASLGRDEPLRIILLLTKRLRERRDTRNDGDDHESQRDDGPDDAPALRGAAVALGEDACVGGVDFAEDEVVALFVQTKIVVSGWDQGGTVRGLTISQILYRADITPMKSYIVEHISQLIFLLIE